MLSFECDYSAGAHELVLKHLIETNNEKVPGYGADLFCTSAKEKIRKACSAPNADIFFLTGGTQTNEVVINSLIESYEGVIAAKTGHISVHEAGAIEFNGHKVLTLPEKNGKISAEDLKNYLRDFYSDENHDHMVFPGMVYLSHPTEYGTLYSKQELTDLSKICKEYDIPLYLDGARLAYGLMSKQTDVTLSDIAQLCDAFYIGGTKVGALCGEAVVFPHGNAPKHFITIVKQHGALLAKGRLIGVQFDALFTDDLYYKIGSHAITAADKLKQAFKEKGYSFFIDSPTNQIFITLENSKLNKLKEKVSFGFWEKKDENHTVVRIATSFATTDEEINELIALL